MWRCPRFFHLQNLSRHHCHCGHLHNLGAGRARTSGEGRGLLGEAGLIAAPVDQGPSLLRQAIGTGQGLEHSVEGIVLEQIAFLDIGGEGGVALVAAELLQLGGMHPPVLRGIHGAALQAVPA